MTFDALSVSAILVSLTVLAVVLATTHRTNLRTEARLRETDEKLRNLSRQTLLLQEYDGARDLCRAIHSLYPDAHPGLDYVLDCRDPDKAYIKKWYLDGPQPTAEEVARALERVRSRPPRG